MKILILLIVLVAALAAVTSAEEWNIIDVVEHEKFFDIDGYESLI